MTRGLPALCVLLGVPALAAQQADTTRAARDTEPAIPHGALAAPVRSMTDLLVARFPGVVVYPTSGLAGLGSRVRIRGHASLSLGNRPVVYLDGLRVEGMLQDHTIFTRTSAPLDDFNPEDLDSIVVVRGPAAGGWYGPEAANGVILLYTARGREGPPRWHVYAEEGRLSDGADWPANYGGVDPGHPDTVYQNGGCTLQAEVAGACTQEFVRSFAPLASRSPFRTSPRRQAGVRVAGGAGRWRYAGGVEFEREAGLYELSAAEAGRMRAAGHEVREDVREPSSLRRLRATGRIDVRLSPAWDLGAWVSALQGDLRLADDDELLRSGLLGRGDSAQNDGWRTRPGELFQILSTQVVQRPTGGIRVAGRVARSVTVEALAGWDDYNAHEVRLIRDGEGPDTSMSGVVTDGGTQVTHRTLSLTAAAEYRLGRRLTARSTGSLRELRRVLDAFTFFGSGLPPGSTNPDSAPMWELQEERAVTALFSAYAEQRIGWRDRLFATAGVRVDERRLARAEFSGEAPRGGYDDLVFHPSFRIEWLPSLRAGSALDRLDVHAAYGTADQRVQGSYLDPERTTEWELGIRAELWNGRAGLGGTLYAQRLVDGLAVVPLPPTAGGPSSRLENVARVNNTGVELSVAAGVVRRDRLRWDVLLTAWGNRNRATRLPPLGTAQSEGAPLGGYGASPFSYADANRNGVIEQSEVVVSSTPGFLGMPFPSHGATLSQSLTLLDRVRVSGLFEYRAGHHLYNGTAAARCIQRVCPELYDRRTPLARQAAAVAAVHYGNTSGFVEPADFLKLRELAVTVGLPRSLASRVGARAASLTLAGRNLLTWTKYSGPDPEVNGTPLPEEPDYFALASSPGPGFATEDAFVQPPPRYWTLRLDVRF